MPGPTVAAVWRVAGVMGIVWVVVGILAPRKRVGLALRVFWTLLFGAHAVGVPLAALVLDDRVQTVLTVYNVLLASTLVSFVFVLIWRIGPALRGVVDSVLGADLERDARTVMERDGRIIGHISGVLFIILMPGLSLFFSFETVEESSRNKERYVIPWEYFWVTVVIGLIGYGASVLVGCSFFLINALQRMDMIVGDPEGVEKRAKTSFTFYMAVLFIFPIFSSVGLILFLFVLSPGDSPNVLTNASLVVIFSTALMLDIFWSLSIFVDVHRGQRRSVMRTADRPWRRSSTAASKTAMARSEQTVDAVFFGNETRSEFVAPWRIVRTAAAIAGQTALLVVLWFCLWITVAGPPEALDADADGEPFWVAHTKAIQGAPAVVFATIVFAPIYGLTMPLLIGSLFSYDAWPKHLLTFAIPFTLLMAGAQAVRGMSTTFFYVSTFATLAIVSFEAVALLVWLRRSRPHWGKHTFSFALSVASVIVSVYLFIYIGVPIFINEETSERDRIAVRIITQVVFSILSHMQIPFGRTLSRNPYVVRHYVPYLLTAPLSIFGRLLVSGVDSILGQFIAVLLLSIIEIASVAAGPLIAVCLVLARDRSASLEQALSVARVRASDCVVASTTVVRSAIEYVGIAVSTVAVLVHALVWYDDIDFGALCLRLLASGAMQLAVEFITDNIVVLIRTRRHDLIFTDAFPGGRRSMVLILAFTCTAVLSVASSTTAVLARTIIKAS